MKSSVQYFILSGNRSPLFAALLSVTGAAACVPVKAPAAKEDVPKREAIAEGALALTGGSPVMCHVFDNGYANMAGPSDAIFVPGPNKACIPDGASGTCRRWLGRCFTNDSAKTPVLLKVFNDGYTGPSALSDAVYISGPNSACVPGGPTGICGRWFGMAVASDGKSEIPVDFHVFDDGYTNLEGPSDAIFWNGSQLCMPGGSTGICRKWFGRGEVRKLAPTTWLPPSLWVKNREQWGGQNRGVVSELVDDSTAHLLLRGQGDLYKPPPQGGVVGTGPCAVRPRIPYRRYTRVGSQVTTKNEFAGGTFSTTMTIPDVTGVVSAFYLYKSDRSEIDIEAYRTTVPNTDVPALRVMAVTHTQRTALEGGGHIFGNIYLTGAAMDDPHTFTIEWNVGPPSVAARLDGNLIPPPPPPDAGTPAANPETQADYVPTEAAPLKLGFWFPAGSGNCQPRRGDTTGWAGSPDFTTAAVDISQVTVNGEQFFPNPAGAVASKGAVQCHVFDDGYTNIEGPSDAIFVPGPNKACIPGGPSGICRKWLGRCFTNDSAKLPVLLKVFNDGYADPSPASDAVYLSGPNSACVPGGPTGICRRWFGLAVASPGEYDIPVKFNVFNDGYSFMKGPTDAIFWNGTQLCMPGGSTGICRKWFGLGELQPVSIP